ncbi:hypothetical protein [Phytoactinopolyspora halotolerans]|uniref:GNAT family N-acetyltransferase n=1 Tax=Phytoactinopolyspora halotolerans TaxID=1981512 RepID=A0A6L9S7A9_9ACTN|nr:hypothetical protein [Phytoactinopolyspora halotolerans]NED99869.1 hypothetical protein [Phytoactinopolyspora halotolerans]
MEQSDRTSMTLVRPANDSPERLLGFRDSASGASIGFYRPADRYDLWEAYVAGVRWAYQQHGAEAALKLPPVTLESMTPVFAVITDDDGMVIGGWYANGPLTAVSQAFAPSEFAADPISATLIAEWIDRALQEGAFEFKGVWANPVAPLKSALADLLARSFFHAMHLLGVRYAFCTAAMHAAPRWMSSGGRPLPGIPPTTYPDERYLTSFLHWDIKSAFRLSTSAQRRLFAADLCTAQWPSITLGVAA